MRLPPGSTAPAQYLPNPTAAAAAHRISIDGPRHWRKRCRAGPWGHSMKARHLIGGAAFPPDTLTIIFQAFDDAWAEVGPSMGTDPSRIEMARLSLATIVLSLAKAGPIERDGLKRSALDAYRFKHGLGC